MPRGSFSGAPVILISGSSLQDPVGYGLSVFESIIGIKAGFRQDGGSGIEAGGDGGRGVGVSADGDPAAAHLPVAADDPCTGIALGQAFGKAGRIDLQGDIMLQQQLQDRPVVQLSLRV